MKATGRPSHLRSLAPSRNCGHAHDEIEYPCRCVVRQGAGRGRWSSSGSPASPRSSGDDRPLLVGAAAVGVLSGVSAVARAAIQIEARRPIPDADIVAGVLDDPLLVGAVGGRPSPDVGAVGGPAHPVQATPVAALQILTSVPPPLSTPHAYRTRLSPEAFLNDGVMAAPPPDLLVMLYQSPSRRPGQYTLPTPSVRNWLLTPRR
jgi:hypothetical protein